MGFPQIIKRMDAFVRPVRDQDTNTTFGGIMTMLLLTSVITYVALISAQYARNPRVETTLVLPAGDILPTIEFMCRATTCIYAGGYLSIGEGARCYYGGATADCTTMRQNEVKRIPVCYSPDPIDGLKIFWKNADIPQPTLASCPQGIASSLNSGSASAGDVTSKITDYCFASPFGISIAQSRRDANGKWFDYHSPLTSQQQLMTYAETDDQINNVVKRSWFSETVQVTTSDQSCTSMIDSSWSKAHIKLAPTYVKTTITNRSVLDALGSVGGFISLAFQVLLVTTFIFRFIRNRRRQQEAATTTPGSSEDVEKGLAHQPASASELAELRARIKALEINAPYAPHAHAPIESSQTTNIQSDENGDRDLHSPPSAAAPVPQVGGTAGTFLQRHGRAPSLEQRDQAAAPLHRPPSSGLLMVRSPSGRMHEINVGPSSRSGAHDASA